MSSRNDNPREGIEFLTRYGHPVYRKDPVYCLGAAALPSAVMFLIAAQIGKFVPSTILLGLIGGSIVASIAIAVAIFQADIDDIPDVLTYPAIEISADTHPGLQVALYDPAETPDKERYRLRVVGEDDAWEVIGTRRGWRNPINEVNRLPQGASAATEQLTSEWGSNPRRHALIDVEKLEPRIERDGREWTLT